MSTSALQAGFSAACAQHAAAGVSINNAIVSEVFIEIFRIFEFEDCRIVGFDIHSPPNAHQPRIGRSVEI
jgi:hypothetical protein